MTVSDNMIDIKNLSKQYKDFSLNSINFSVPKGSIMGFVGENGAGKTTTIKALLGLIEITDGEITILGENSKHLSTKCKSEIGVVFDGSNLHENLKLKNIALIMNNIYPNWDNDVFHEYCTKFKLTNGKTIKEYSRGMKMKLSIAIALSHHSKLLILDEATSGLDPIVRDEILDIFLDFIQDEEHTILLSSHIISDIEKIADYVTFIHQGRIIFSENKDTLLNHYCLVPCKKEDLKKIDPSFIAGVRENSFGAEVLIENKSAFLKNHSNYPCEKASIEDIMLFISRGKEQLR